MTKKTKTFVGLASGVVLLWAAWTFYIDYWLPTKELQTFGIDWIKPWTPRSIDRHHWIDGSQVVYSFSISKEMEGTLRARCLTEDDVKKDAQLGSCYLAHKKLVDKPAVDLELQKGTLKLYFTG
jgi:hypothetical protein